MTRLVRSTILFVGLILGLAAWPLIAGPGTAAAQQESAEAADLLPDERNTIDIVNRYGPSVVAITVTVQGEAQVPEEMRQLFNVPEVQRSAGSGFVVNDEGQLITNVHVVSAALQENSAEMRQNASITVNFPNSDENLPVRVVGINPDYDLALLELENADDLPEGVEPIPFAAVDRVEVGQKAIAIGNPFRLRSTVTTGIVSAIERERPGAYGLEIPFLQTDAAINPGNSGGPLLNSRGELIGVNNAILTPSGGFAGVGFAVPASLVQESLPGLQEGGVSGLVGALRDPGRPVLGIQAALDIADYPMPLRQELNLPDRGAVVTSVQAESPAAEAGLRGPQFTVTYQGQQYPAGVDVIMGADGEQIAGVRDLQRFLIENTEPGDTVTLQVFRNGETIDIDVTLVSAEELQQP